MTDNYQSTGERPEIHGAFKVSLWFIAISVVANILGPLFLSESIALMYAHSPFYVLISLFLAIVLPTIIAAMAFISFRERRGDTPILLQAYTLYMILGALALHHSDILDWKMLITLAIWLPCFFYISFSKQVRRIFPLEERNLSIRLVLSLIGLLTVYVLSLTQMGSFLQYGFTNDERLFIDEKTLSDDEYSDGLIRLKKPAGLTCGTHYIDGEEIITLFNDDCVYFLKSGFWEAETAMVNDSLLAALAGPEFWDYPYELMSDNGFGIEGDPRINAHRKCYVYYTEPYPTMVDIVILRDWLTSKYCLVYGKYEQGTGSHTTEICDAVRFK